jgi:hypothetical protein
MRFPVSCKNNSSGSDELVFVDQTLNWFASVKTRLPFFKRESVERFPLTGWSRFAIQTTVALLLYFCVNHMAKE